MSILQEGWECFRLGEFERALEKFHLVESRSAADSPEYLESLMGQASLWNTRQDKRDPRRAEKLYLKIVKLAPGSQAASWASLDLVRIMHLTRADQPLDYVSLAKNYRQVALKYPGTSAAEEALLQAMALEEIQADRGKLLNLIKEYQDFLTTHPESGYKGAVYGAMARLYDSLRRYEEKLTSLLHALEFQDIDKLNPNEQYVWIYWTIAVTAEFDVGNFPVARRFYNKLLAEYPSDLLVFRAREALSRMDRVESDLKLGRAIPESQPLGSLR
ncbi:MAG: hypothetical protein SFU85_03335 [Candidatus Methylacidiphilales bacterium]|nr:hypothetical protein [Candidatus Methylacidiphilales bacterium]